MIGLGIIGSRVAENLRHRGFYAFVWNRTPRPVPNFVGSPGEVAELCDIVQIFVSDDDALLQMVQRLTSKLTPRHIIMAHSTVAPDTVRAAAEIVERRGAKLLDVPFTGSKGAAEKGQLVYYVGGDEASIQEARPVLAASSQEIIFVGGVGDASTIKIATNIITAGIVQGAAEALALVVDAGISAEKFQLAMKANGSNSMTLDMKLPKMLVGDYEPQFSVKHMLKDMDIASRMARLAEVELGVADAARRALTAEVRAGRGDVDFSSILRAYFPTGLPTAAIESESNGEGDEHPTFAGLDERQTAPEHVAAAASVPDETTTATEATSDVAAAIFGETAPEIPMAESIVSVAEGGEPADQSQRVGAEGPADAVSVDDSSVAESKSEEREATPVSVADHSPTAADRTPGVAEIAAPQAEKAHEAATVFRRFFRRGSDD